MQQRLRRHSPSPENFHRFVHDLSKLSLRSVPSSPNSATFSEDSIDTAMTDAPSDGPSDEGFHEEWPPFSPRDLMRFMTEEECTGIINIRNRRLSLTTMIAFIKDWTCSLSHQSVAEIYSHCAQRIHKDMIRVFHQNIPRAVGANFERIYLRSLNMKFYHTSTSET